MLPRDPNSAVREDESPTYGLEEVIINISISEWSPDVSSYRLAKHCHQDLSFIHRADHRESRLESQLTSLVSQSPKLKLARVLYHVLPSLQWHAFDGMSQARMTLSPGSAWDEAGEICWEEEHDSESSSSSSSQ